MVDSRPRRILEVSGRSVAGCLIVALLAPACTTSGGPARPAEQATAAPDQPECAAFADKARAQVQGSSVGYNALRGAAAVGIGSEGTGTSATARDSSAAGLDRVVGPPYSGSPTSSDSLVGLAIYGGFVALGALVGAVTTVVKNDDTQESAHADALAICLRPARLTRDLGPEHPEVARSLHALGYRYHRLGEHATAEPLYLRALAIQEASLGKEAPEVATTLADYAALLRQTGRTRQAWDVERRVEEIRRANP